MRPSLDPFDPERHARQLLPVLEALRRAGDVEPRELDRLLRRHPKDGRGVFSKNDLIRGFRHFARRHGWDDEEAFARRLRMKPVRTLSGVAPVTLLTKPFPCPGKCIFCPSDVRMPKSYLAREPGAQRAAQHRFDPYGQTLGRLLALYGNGHQVDKVELIVLGGTWSFYPEPYQVWFVKRAFDALNDFESLRDATGSEALSHRGRLAYDELGEEVDGTALDLDGPAAQPTYNRIVADFLRRRLGGELLGGDERASWEELARAQERNERAAARSVGLVVETRPDHLSPEEVVRIRRLGATKVQIGVQSLSDEVLARNRRGHDVAATRRAFALLRQAGFKIHAHWMANLYGSDPERDVADFERLFTDPGLRPDELKIYPCSLIATAELMRYHEAGRWRPYATDELLRVLTRCLLRVPSYCRVTRVIRDIPGDDIVTGNTITNFRQVVERELRRQGRASRDIRAREVRGREVDANRLRLGRQEYATATGREVFLELTTADDRLAGFLRLSLPERPSFVPEIATSAVVREVHVYGAALGIGERRPGRSQHAGLGRRLVGEARRLASTAGFRDLAVISSVGTRNYYRGLGFRDGELYQHLDLGRDEPAAGSQRLDIGRRGR